jgi:peptide/nickel transport system substrate-binding protein
VTNLPRFIADALFDSLLQVDPTNGSLKPGLAESWQVADDARSFTFHLRAGVRWHDGQTLTAQDIVFTVKALSDPNLRLTPAADFGPLADVVALDEHTVQVRLNDAYCPALTNIGTLKILPEHVLGTPLSSPLTKGGQEGGAALSADQFVGSGPLVLKTWSADTITFTPNANYWNGAPPIAEWTYRIFATVAEAQAALNAGQVDLLALDAAQDAGSSPPPDLKIYTRASNQFYAMAINNEAGIFTDARVRQALAMALNRPGLAADSFGKDAQVLQTSVLPGFWASPTDAAQPAYDPAGARQMLSDAGWADSDSDGVLDKEGKPLRVTLWAVADDPIGEPLAFSVREMLAQVGVQALLQLDDRDGMLTRLFLHEYDLALAPWNIPLDPDQHWYWQSNENKKGDGLNFASFSNSRVDDLLQRGNQTPGCDPNARRSIYAQAYRTIADDVPQVFLFAPPAYLVTRARVLGLEPGPFSGDYWNLNSWQVAP